MGLRFLDNPAASPLAAMGAIAESFREIVALLQKIESHQAELLALARRSAGAAS